MKIKSTIALFISASLAASPALSQKKTKPNLIVPATVVPEWMNPEVSEAWNQGFRGQGVTITVVDDYRSTSRYDGNFAGKNERLRHGDWTLKEANLIAPSATMVSHDFNSRKKVNLNTGLNVLNLSYGIVSTAGFSSFRWSANDKSIIDYAHKGLAVISKAAGNDYGIAVGQPNENGKIDYLNRDLISAKSAIFVGALDSNGTVQNPARMADYSNIAGENIAVRNQFLVVGVDSQKTELYGTSFAAPIVSGYAAIVGSKFTKATATQVTNQLLNTARTDTISGYSPQIHGRGEASISRALAPISIR